MFDLLLFINQSLNTFVATNMGMGPNQHVVLLVSFGCTYTVHMLADMYN